MQFCAIYIMNIYIYNLGAVIEKGQDVDGIREGDDGKDCEETGMGKRWGNKGKDRWKIGMEKCMGV